MVVDVADREVPNKVQLTALRDQRLEAVEDRARAYCRAMIEADRASKSLTDALLAASALNEMVARTVSDQTLADWVNQGIAAHAEAFGRPLQMSLMAVRRRIGKAVDNRRERRR